MPIEAQTYYQELETIERIKDQEPDTFLPAVLLEAITLAATEAPQFIPPPPVVAALKLHIDGDFLAYATAGNDDTLPGQARLNMMDRIDRLRTRIGAGTVVVHSTVPGSNKGERYLSASVKPYQAQRKSGRKPRNQPYLQEYLLTYVGPAFTSKLWSTREADDGMAACAHYAIGGDPGYAAIATKDKDMRMFPGHHIDWDTLEVTVVPPGAYSVIGDNGKQYGLKFFWLQMLMGDDTDNIPGLEHYTTAKGALRPVGPKTAEGFLADCVTSDQACVRVMDLYRGSYLSTWEDRFVEQASLLWMRCSSETAPVDDFATHMGASRINTPFTPGVIAAVGRLNERVTLARAALNAITV